jgi:hypothetical protein
MGRREEVFFLVWCEGGGAPTARHLTFATAKAEATRLARANPGKRFTVMVAVQGIEKNDVQSIDYLGFDRTLDDEIPF